MRIPQLNSDGWSKEEARRWRGHGHGHVGRTLKCRCRSLKVDKGWCRAGPVTGSERVAFSVGIGSG